MAFEFLLYERKGPICYLTLNRPEKLNALNAGLMAELREAFATIEVRAYPRDLIARPHWFNDELGGKALMVSYCILCNSGQAFVPVLADGRRLDLRNMTAFDNNTIYYCTRTGNFIQQLDARVIGGPNEGENWKICRPDGPYWVWPFWPFPWSAVLHGREMPLR